MNLGLLQYLHHKGLHIQFTAESYILDVVGVLGTPPSCSEKQVLQKFQEQLDDDYHKY